MALIDTLTDIADAIRSKAGITSKISLKSFANLIRQMRTVADLKIQQKTVSSSEDDQIIYADTGYDYMSKVTVPGVGSKYVGTGVTRQAAKTITPTKSKQTALSSGVYTTGTITVDAIPSNYIEPSGSQTLTSNDTYDVTKLAQVVVNVAGGGGGLPTGIKSIAYGKATISQTSGGSTFTVTHNLGEVPDMFIFYAPSNIATTYSMMFVARSTKFAYRGSTYQNICGYHGNSTTTMTYTNVTTSYGVKSLTATQATITTYSTSTSYYWRAGTYEYIAVKFS